MINIETGDFEGICTVLESCFASLQVIRYDKCVSSRPSPRLPNRRTLTAGLYFTTSYLLVRISEQTNERKGGVKCRTAQKFHALTWCDLFRSRIGDNSCGLDDSLVATQIPRRLASAPASKLLASKAHSILQSSGILTSAICMPLRVYNNVLHYCSWPG